jgi:hypothetical protein
VLSVTANSIEISQIDMVDGTPVLDVKPYIPYDVIPSSIDLPMLRHSNVVLEELAVPAWIYDADIELRTVLFTEEATESLRALVRDRLLRFCDGFEHAVKLIEQVLAQDIRGIHQGRGAVDVDRVFECRLDDMRLEFCTDETSILVQRIEHVR